MDVAREKGNIEGFLCRIESSISVVYCIKSEALVVKWSVIYALG